MKCFTIYDSKSELFAEPFWCQTRAVAIRSLEAAANREGTDFFNFAEDFTLFEIGEFDVDSGKLQAYETPHAVITTIELKKEAM